MLRYCYLCDCCEPSFPLTNVGEWDELCGDCEILVVGKTLHIHSYMGGFMLYKHWFCCHLVIVSSWLVGVL